MSISRREWLQAGLLTGAALGVPGLHDALAAAVADRQGAARPQDETEFLTRSLLARELNTSFVAWRGTRRPVGLRLVRVSDTDTAAAAGTVGSEDCFSASFQGAAYAPLEQGTYKLSHATLGSLTLFLVPVGQSGRVRTYELTVNRVAR